MNCCENDLPTEANDQFSSKTDLEFFDALEDLTYENKGMDIRIVAYIIKQKDIYDT